MKNTLKDKLDNLPFVLKWALLFVVLGGIGFIFHLVSVFLPAEIAIPIFATLAISYIFAGAWHWSS